ncbi:prevent-host-death protein [Pseudactinotalea sp. Z1732]|uniref:prevent-host-death protein n=1 Tax=Micrococcales TaxID=85006 RepID=UPI003C7A0584
MTLAADHPAYTRRSSDLSKHSAEVFAEAEDHPVTVTRRDGESLVLMSQREANARAELLHIAATLITVTLEEGPLSERMASRYPWMYALSSQDREQCARDLIDAARASFSTQQPHLAIAQLASWRETATAIAAGLGSQPVEWLDENDDAVVVTVVERP